MAPRKVRLVVDLVRGLPVAEAERRLTFLKKDASRPVLKLLQSAIANAEHNFNLDRATLVVKSIAADGGTTLKRFRPRAHGRAAPIRKRTTHITIVLAPASEVPTKPTKTKKTTKKTTTA
jgi:large subunit ribosomal protein L22